MNWGDKTAPQTALNGREIDYARGKGLGGSSAIASSHYSKELGMMLQKTIIKKAGSEYIVGLYSPIYSEHLLIALRYHVSETSLLTIWNLEPLHI